MLQTSEPSCSLIRLKRALHGTFLIVNKLCLNKPWGKERHLPLLISQTYKRLAFRGSSSSSDLLLEKGYSLEDSCHELKVRPGEQLSFSVRDGREKLKSSPTKNMPLLHVGHYVNQDVLCGNNFMLIYRQRLPSRGRMEGRRWRKLAEHRGLLFNKHWATYLVHGSSQRKSDVVMSEMKSTIPI